MTETMLIRMARAMYERPIAGFPSDKVFDELMAFEKELLINDVKAALEAIRAPSEEMTSTAQRHDLPCPVSRPRFRRMWEAVVSSILQGEA